MTRDFFGTDGIRGEANTFPMTAEVALKLGAAAGRYFRKDEKMHRVVIGKDTRRSSYMFEYALTSGFMSTGMNVLLMGPVPTPAVGTLTRTMRADVGVMISASHNKHTDNGIKFFGPDGYKLSDEAEMEIEALLQSEIKLARPENIGRAKRIDDALGRYMEYVKTTFPKNLRLDGLKVVVDCANGAAYKAAPEVLWELGAEVIPIGVNPTGYNINENCGSTYPQTAAEAVIAHNADVGITLDGDADRVMIIDEKGEVADGDQIMGLIASRWHAESRLDGNTLVSTVMSNLGLERYLNDQDITLERTNVGDRYVVQRMREGGFNLGGEQSGHIILRDYVTTGDGLIAGLQFLEAMVASGKPASELTHQFTPVPQILKNVKYEQGQTPLNSERVKRVIASAEEKLKKDGRLLIRKSGTEPLIRVMGEHVDEQLLDEVLSEICTEIDAV